MKTVLRAGLVVTGVVLLAALVLSGTIDLPSAFGLAQSRYPAARRLLLGEDFGIGVYLGGSFDEAIGRVGAPSSQSEYGRTRSATYELPLGGGRAARTRSQGTLVVEAQNGVVASVSLSLRRVEEGAGEDLSFAGVPLEALEPDDLIELLGRPAARFVVLGDMIFAWYLVPPLQAGEGGGLRLAETITVTASFSKSSRRLQSLRVKVPPRQTESHD